MTQESKKVVIATDGYDITVRRTLGRPDYISLTDFAKRDSDDPNAVIQNWMRSRSTVEYLGIWEQMNNPDFLDAEAAKHLVMAGKNSFTMSPKKWIETTNAIGMESKPGRYGGTYAHEDIALEFMSWVSPKFKLYFLQEYKRLKRDEGMRLYDAGPQSAFYLPGSNNTAIFVDLPGKVEWQESYGKLSAEDLVNLAVFGLTQKEFEAKYRTAIGTIHNNSSVDHILVYGSLLHKNHDLSTAGVGIEQRLSRLNEAAISMLRSRFGSAGTDVARLSPAEQGEDLTETGKTGE